MRRALLTLSALAALGGCRENFTGDDEEGTDEGCSPGMHGCACVEGDCLGDLVCLPDLDICAEPGGTETGDGTSTSDGTDTGPTDDGTSASSSSDTGMGDCFHRVFVTSQKYLPASDFANTDNADDLCETEAAGLGGTFKAVLSGPMAASARLELCGDVYLANDGAAPVDDTLVALEEDWWSAEHVAPISTTPTGTEVATTHTVWTGTKVDGTPTSQTCENWNDGTGETVATVGNPTMVGGAWIGSGAGSCNQAQALYCLEQF